MATVKKGTMNRAVQYADPPSIKTVVAELPIETPGPGEVLVRMLYSGVCHTDYGFCTNSFGLPMPAPAGQVGGHEGIGEVIEQGPGVTTPEIGAKVGIKYAADACLNCENCLVGGETSCSQVKVSGYFTPGTFQQYVISSAKYVTPIPDGIDLAAAAPLMCGGVTVYAALKRSNTKHGNWVLVTGAGGGLGHLAIQFAKAIGARVIAVDSGSKESFCKGFGADAFVDFTKFSTDEDITAEVRRIAPNGVKTVIACATPTRSYNQTIGFLGFRGVLVCLGLPENDRTPIKGAEAFTLLNNELTIMSLKAGNRLEAKECLDIVARGLVKTHYELRPMESISDVRWFFHLMVAPC
ncbi:chaperonin 10-like protein [Leptodontidium sp. MPI-SDFR-AT-0119]|nr:chaperonin 10-like protein [Leptodontidium sp. MPI-SDFR-AT-0119]